MAPETLFLALQCVQCATMQVKPQKKSSNKWVCVVCNQRQSVLRIYAQGYRAADLRRFVQEANLSRGRRELAPAPEAEWDPAAATAEEEQQQYEFPRKKKRADWSEYLDEPGELDGCGGVEEGTPDGGTDIEVITELPQERAKGRPRKAQLGVPGNKLKPPSHPILPKRQRIGQGSSSYSATATAKGEKSQWNKNLNACFAEKNGPESSEQDRTELDECATTDVVVDDEAVMGKSPAKWIKTVLLGKKSTKSGSTKTNESKDANNNGCFTGEEGALSGNSPVISQPVLVNVHKSGAVSASGKSEIPNSPSDQAEQQGLQNQSIPDPTPLCPGEPIEEQAAVKAQAAFRGHLARRSFRALKGIIRLQALIRGHLVRRQAVSTLRTTWLIVKFQAIVRGRNVRLSGENFGQIKFVGVKSSDEWKEKLSSNVYVRKLLSSSISPEPLHYRYDKRDPNSVYNWLERWTISRIWKPASQPKRVTDGKPQVRKASYAMATESAKLKRNARKVSAVTVEGFHTSMAVESEKPKWNSRKFPSSLSDSVPDSQLSELEKVKRNLRKATNSMVEASKLSSARADSSKVSDSIPDVPKVSNPTAETSKIPSLMNGMSDHQDIQCEEALQNTHEISFPLGEQEHSDNGHLLEYSDEDNFNLLPGLKIDLETPLDSVFVGNNVEKPTVGAPAVEAMPLPNTNSEDNALWKKEEARSKEEHQSNGSYRTSKRKSSFSNKSERMENGTHTTTVQPRQPSYMAATESLKAKLRAQNSPRLDSDSSAEKNGFIRRHSLPSSANSRAIKAEWKR